MFDASTMSSAFVIYIDILAVLRHVLRMICLLSLPLPARFALILKGVCVLVFGRMGAVSGASPVLMVLHARLVRMMARFDRILARREDACRVRGMGVGDCAAVCAAPAVRLPQAVRLPGRFGWLREMMAEQAAYRMAFNVEADRLATMLGDPGMVALIEARPSLRRLLRPLCRAMGIRPSVALAGVARVRVRRVREAVGPKPPSRVEVMREVRYGRPGTASYFPPRRLRAQ